MPHKHCPASSHAQTPRQQFRAWISYVLAQRGVELPHDPSWQEIKAALEPFLEIREG